MPGMTCETTANRLVQWGLWARDNGSVLIGYPNQAPVTPAAPSRGRSAAITDDEAMKLDRIVANLVSRDQEMGRAVVVYYMPNGSFSRVASVLRISWNRANILVNSGTAWVDCAMDIRGGGRHKNLHLLPE